jgi:NTP pyrophosphatase (non-canonical NTP hydrolase)
MESAMKRYTERALRSYIRNHSKWGPAKVEERLRFFALAICGEAGELANFVKKEWRGDLKGKGRTAKQVWKGKCVSEAADVGAYTMMYLDLLTGGHLGEEVFKKFMEVETRANYQAALRKRVARVKCGCGPYQGCDKCGKYRKRPQPMLRTLLGSKKLTATTWVAVVRKWLDNAASTGITKFVLSQLYASGALLGTSHPDNHFVEEKLRQTLQVLRDKGDIEFLGKGAYRIAF